VWLQRLQARVCGLSLQPIGCTFALACDATEPQQLQCAFMWRYISVGLYPFYLLYILKPKLHMARHVTSQHAI